MRRRTRILAVVVGALLLAACLVPTLWFKPCSPTHPYTRIFATFVLRSPMKLSQLQFLPAWLDLHSDELDDRSVAYDNRPALDGSRPGVFYANLRERARQRLGERPDRRLRRVHRAPVRMEAEHAGCHMAPLV